MYKCKTVQLKMQCLLESIFLFILYLYLFYLFSMTVPN